MSLLDPISHEIWDMKYRFKDPDGLPFDDTVEDTWRRVAGALANAEDTEELADEWEAKFFDVMADYKFLPAGRILAGAGTGRKVTLFNCYVMGTIEDSMPGIFDSLKESALTMQQGGGIGMAFSTLRPAGAPVVGVGSDASGPLTFMDCWDTMCKTIMSAGSRRGAMMATMRCDHPDIEAFINAKHDPLRFRNFNVSVLVTDDFMLAVKKDDPWDLVFGEGFNRRIYKTVSARDLWQSILQSTYDTSEPGVIFIDRVNNDNNLHYCETIASSNPCGEQMLPPYGACLLGSINLSAFVTHPFQDSCMIDVNGIRATVKTAIRMLDNVVDVSNYPLEQQAFEAKAKRRLGLGVTGLADALAMMRIRYGTDAGAEFAGIIMEEVNLAAYEASVDLAREKGSFPALDVDKYLAPNTHAGHLPAYIGTLIRKHGIRNSHVTSIAPTGTISLFAGNVSSGLEPIFAYDYQRKVLMPDGTKETHSCVDKAVLLWRSMYDKTPLPDYFVTAQELTPLEHVKMQAAMQPWVDSSISKTINCPTNITFDAFKDVYIKAYETGCKGCTTHRPNDIRDSVISVTKEEHITKAEPKKASVLVERNEILPGFTYKIKFGDDHAMYVTINDIIENGKRMPYEIFVNSKNVEAYAWTVALTRMVSAVFRRGGDVTFVVEELKAVFDPRGGNFYKGRYVPSIVAAIGGVIEQHMKDLKLIDDTNHVIGNVIKDNTNVIGTLCNKCNAYAVIRSEGCDKCLECGHSKCG